MGIFRIFILLRSRYLSLGNVRQVFTTFPQKNRTVYSRIVDFKLSIKKLTTFLEVEALGRRILEAKAFLLTLLYYCKSEATLTKPEEAKMMADASNELSESYAHLAQAVKGTAVAAKATKQLWRNGKRSPLIKAGLALIAFPDPTISDVVGSALLAAGVVQEGIRRRTLHVDDVYKTFQGTMREVRSMKL